MRRSVGVALALLVLAVVLVGGPSLFTSPTTSELAPENVSDPRADIVRPTGGESGFWPYLNSRQSFEKRSPINVVVAGETDDVVRLLTATDDGEWEETDEEQEEADPDTYAVFGENETEANESSRVDVENGSASREDENGRAFQDDENGSTLQEDLRAVPTQIQWQQTTGANRYAYVEPGGGEPGRWVGETAQVHDGTYYGSRYHVRMYESPNPDEPWVAMQTHSEYFDWFTLRHRVTGSQKAQIRLEADLMAIPQVDQREDVSRVYLGNRNASDSDGWATFVDLVGVVTAGLVVGLSSRPGRFDRIVRRVDARLTETDRRRIDAVRERVDARHLILAGTIVAIFMGVRVGGITLERTTDLSMHAIAVLLYPFVGVGLPIATYAIASGLERRLDASIVAGTSLAVANWLDYGLLGVTSLPIDLIFQRMLVVVALGLLAGGAASRATAGSGRNDMLSAGAVLWLLVLAGTLLGFI